jgi:hypothetical protein
MNKNKSPQSSKKALEDFFNFLQGPEDDVQSLPIEDVRTELKRQNIDVSSLVASVQKTIAAERLKAAHQKRERIATLTAHYPINSSDGQGLKARILELLRNKPDMAVAYRKFEEASDADLVGLLDDFDILDMLDAPDEQH